MEQAELDLIVIEAKLGDDKAFECLYRHFQQAVLRYSYKVHPDRQMTQEANQNTWLKIAKNLPKLNDPRAFRSWLFQTAHWQMLDLLRKQAHVENKVVDENMDELAVANESALCDKNHSELYQHINCLADIDKQAIHLFYLEELSLQEISIILSVPVGTVKSRLNRARKQLKEKLTR